MNLQPLIDQYIEHLRYEIKSSSCTVTGRFYELHMFKRYMKERKGIEDIREIKIHHLRSYISHLSIEKSYQETSLGNTISGLRALFAYALQRDIVPVNIVQKIKKPKLEQKEVEHFNWDEVEALFLSAPRTTIYLRDITIMVIFYYCGVRLDELRHIRVSDFSEDLTELYVEKGKGDKSRLLPVHPFVQRVVKLYLKSMPDNSSYLFMGNNSNPLSKSRIGNIVKTCGARAGITKRASPHTFRHSFATHLHQKGVDINRLAQLLGHANIEKTAIYTHTDESELIEAVNLL